MQRRTVLKLGALSALTPTLGLSYDKNKKKDDTSVILLWLGGGATQFETFNPGLNCPPEFSSVTGAIESKTGYVGGLFPKLAQLTDNCTIFNSFSHNQANHGQGTHYMLTGENNAEPNEGASPKEPSMGSIISSYFGVNQGNVPTYTRINSIYADGAAWLGANYNPYDANGEGRDNLRNRVESGRFNERKRLVDGLDRFNHDKAISWKAYREQTFDLILGPAHRIFNVDNEPKLIQEAYGKGVGRDLLLARRLCESGCKFVTIHNGGWDNHSDIQKAMQNLCPPIDQAISAFINDMNRLGNKKIMLVVMGEFGRTKLNGTAGRDHWPGISPLMFVNGIAKGSVYGKNNKSYEPTDSPVNPTDVVTTTLDYLGIPNDYQKTDTSGRPRYLINGKIIKI